MALQRIPGIPYAAAPRAESSAQALSWPPKLIVIHDTGNLNSTKENEASYAHTRNDSSKRWTSAHAYVDELGPLGSLRLDRQAWAAYGYANANGVHIEMCLRGDRTKTRQITAALVRQLCQMAGIPMVKLSPADVAAGKRGVCGHRDITLGLGVGDHTDPGADFPWTQFMSWVNAASAAVDGGSMELTSTVTEIALDGDVPTGWGVANPETGQLPLSFVFGSLHRRLYLVYKGLVATYAIVKGMRDNPPPAAAPTDAQMDALGARLEAVLAAKLGNVVVQAELDPQVRAARVEDARAGAELAGDS